MDSEDGELFIKSLAGFVRTHERALANALQYQRRSAPRHGASQSVSSIPTVGLSPSSPVPERPSTSASSGGALAAALSLGSLSLSTSSVKPAKLALTPHHLFYLLSRFEELGMPVGPMKVRLENLHDSTTSANYVSFLSQSQRTKSRASDVGSIRSVSSIRSVMTGMSTFWASFGLGSSISAARVERQKAALQADLKYLYSAFTKIPTLKLSPDYRARLIRGYEEFPFDSAVPLYVFKNVQVLEVCDIDFRQFFGWDKVADHVRSLTLRRAGIDDPADVLIDIVLDDMDRRRMRSSKSQASPMTPWAASSSPRRSPTMVPAELHRATSAPGSPDARKRSGDLRIGSAGSGDMAEDPRATYTQGRNVGRRPSVARQDSDDAKSPSKTVRARSNSPRRPGSSRHGSVHMRSSHKVRRSGSGSSQSSLSDSWHGHGYRSSAPNLLSMGVLPASKWRFLKHLSLAENSLTSIPAASLAPLANTLHSLDLSSNLLTQIPDSLATLTALRALNLSQCMIDSLHSLTRNPLPAISALNLRGNRLQSIAGVEKLFPLERLDLRDNRLTDPLELARLTGIPEIREIWVEGNPFTRTHRDYRITIFNLFRKTPGYTEDITIDATGPTYSEKRCLVDRVPIPAAVPVVKPTVPEAAPIEVIKPTIIYDTPKESSVLRKERPLPKATASEINTSSTRRRRAAKKRIVDLATANPSRKSPQQVTGAAADSSNVVNADAENNYRISHAPESQVSPTGVLGHVPETDTPTPPEVPRIDTAVVSQIQALYASSKTQDMSDESSDWDSGELYRRKIEALRDKVGNGYLSVLSEEGWEASQPPRYIEAGLSPTSTPTTGPIKQHVVNAQPITSGRTLG